MDRPFEIQADKLRTRLIKMGSLVDEQVDSAFRAVEENNSELADSVEEGDQKVDKHDTKIEKLCYKILAINQPVANDLRFVMSALKINMNLERIGDLAVKITKFSRSLESKPDFFEKIKLTDITAMARRMLKNAIDSFINSDIELSNKVLEDEVKLDELVRSDSRILVDIMKEESSSIEAAVTTYTIISSIERMGDHANNIAKEIYFIVNAQSLKHEEDIESFED